MPLDLAVLRQRKIVQWGAAYLAAAWVMIQVIALLSEQFRWSDAVAPAFTVALGFGFPLCLLLAWYHGERGRQRVTTTEALLIAGLLAVGATATAATAKRQPGALTGSGPAAGSNSAPDQASIAVLPFVNMSGDPENEYFSDGLTEELLNALANVEGLRVAARTSSFAYKGKDESVPRIGSQLNVAHVLEGSVRKSGNQLRITAQLIKVADGYHLWSDTYDRELKDVFAIQDEIARAITSSMRVRLLKEQPARAIGAERLAAFDLILKGRYLMNARTPRAMREAIPNLENAVAQDSTWAYAHAELAAARITLAFYRIEPPAQTYAQARAGAEHALRLDPNLAEAHGTLGAVALSSDWDFAKAERELRRAIELKPSYAQAYLWLGNVMAVLGRWPDAEALTRQAQQLDPLAPPHTLNQGVWQMMQGRCDQALPHFRAAIALSPENPFSHAMLSEALRCTNDQAQALHEQERAVKLSDRSPLYVPGLAVLHAQAGRRDLARRILNEMTDDQRAAAPPSTMATAYALLGDNDAAIEWLERGLAQRDHFMIYMRVHPFHEPLRALPGFESVVQRMRLPAPAKR